MTTWSAVEKRKPNRTGSALFPAKAILRMKNWRGCGVKMTCCAKKEKS